MSILKDTRCRKCGEPFSQTRFWDTKHNEYLLDGIKCHTCEENRKAYTK